MHLAQAPIKNTFLNPGIQTQDSVTFVGNLISLLLTLGLIIGSIYFIFMLILGGIAWIGSGGDKAGAEAARGRITAAIIGIIILFSVFAVVAAVQSIFGLNILNINIDALKIK